MTSVYLCASYALKDAVNAFAKSQHQIRIVSTWHGLDHTAQERDHVLRDDAIRDLEEIDRADEIWCFNKGPVSPGRFFELGYATAKGKVVRVYTSATLPHRENDCIFFRLPQVSVSWPWWLDDRSPLL